MTVGSLSSLAAVPVLVASLDIIQLAYFTDVDQYVLKRRILLFFFNIKLKICDYQLSSSCDPTLRLQFEMFS